MVMAGLPTYRSNQPMLRHRAGHVPRRSVMTIEDPVESLIPGISQSELDPSGGTTLASVLGSAVRQDVTVANHVSALDTGAE